MIHVALLLALLHLAQAPLVTHDQARLVGRVARAPEHTAINGAGTSACITYDVACLDALRVVAALPAPDCHAGRVDKNQRRKYSQDQ